MKVHPALAKLLSTRDEAWKEADRFADEMARIGQRGLSRKPTQREREIASIACGLVFTDLHIRRLTAGAEPHFKEQG